MVILGSARSSNNSDEYKMTVKLSQLIAFVTGELSERGYISRNDLSLFIRVNSVEKALGEILQFHRVYHSI